MKIECPDCARVLEFVSPAIPVEPWVRLYGELLGPQRGRMRCPWCWGQQKHRSEEKSILAIGSWAQLPQEDRQSVYDKLAKLQAQYDKELKKHKEGAIRFRRATQMAQALRFAVETLKVSEQPQLEEEGPDKDSGFAANEESNDGLEDVPF